MHCFLHLSGHTLIAASRHGLPTYLRTETNSNRATFSNGWINVGRDELQVQPSLQQSTLLQPEHPMSSLPVSVGRKSGATASCTTFSWPHFLWPKLLSCQPTLISLCKTSNCLSDFHFKSGFHHSQYLLSPPPPIWIMVYLANLITALRILLLIFSTYKRSIMHNTACPANYFIHQCNPYGYHRTSFYWWVLQP